MRRHYKSIWSSRRVSIIVSAAAGVLTGIIFTLIFAAFTYFLMDSMALTNFFCTTAMVVGGFSGGYVCGRFRRRRGLAEGIMCGAVMYLICAAAGFVFLGVIMSVKKLLLLVIISSAGGVAGVNSKRPKRLRTD